MKLTSHIYAVLNVNILDSYPALLSYGVKFYGADSAYDKAGSCEIINYGSKPRCFCVDYSSSCSTFSRTKISDCSNIVSSSYRQTMEAGYVIAIICVFFLFFYVTFDIYYIRNHPGDFQPASVVEASAGVPTTAAYVKPSIVVLDSPDSVAIIDSTQNDENHGHNSYFGSVELVAIPTADERSNSIATADYREDTV